MVEIAATASNAPNANAQPPPNDATAAATAGEFAAYNIHLRYVE